MLAEGLGLSGIVSILFTGIVSYSFFCSFSCLAVGKMIIFIIYADADIYLLLFVLGDETLYLLKFVTQFSAICIRIFSSDIIVG